METRMVARSKADAAAIVQEIQRQASTKRDVVVGSGDIRMVQDGRAADGSPRAPRFVVGASGSVPVLGDGVVYDIRDTAHRLAAEKLGIPLAYYRRMLTEEPDLLVANVNRWLERSGKNYLIRTLDGAVRALLSDSFRMVDNVDLFMHGAQTGIALGAEITEVALTDERFYLRMTHPEWRERIELQKAGGVRSAPQVLKDAEDGDGGDYVVPGVLLTNSEVGLGQYTVEFYLRRLSCMNGMVTDVSLAKSHLGAKHDVGVVSEETRRLSDQLVWSQIADIVRTAFDRDNFRAYVRRMQEAADMPLEAPVAAVDAVVKSYDLSDADRQMILNELMSPSVGVDPGRTVWGLMNAVTATARRRGDDDPDAELALQRVGGKLLSASVRSLAALGA